MTSLIRYEDIYLESVWESMRSWLETALAEPVTNHRRLLRVADDLEILDQELYDLDRSIQTLTPSEELVAHRLGLRLQGVEEAMFAKWRHPSVRKSALRALQGIYERYLGHIRDAQRVEVVFEISRMFRNPDLGGFIEAHRTEMLARWAPATGNSFGCSLVVVEGPRWVHELYSHLVDESLRGASLRKRYIQEDGNGIRREHPFGHVVGDAVPKPDPETLETALILWEPGEELSPYRRFAAAVRAAQRV